MYTFQILTQVDPVKWNNDLLKSDCATFLQTSEYLKSTSDKYYPVFIYVFDENHTVVGQLGLHVVKTATLYASSILLKLLKTISNITKRGVWLYGPVIHTNDAQQRQKILEVIVKAIDEVLDKHNLVFIYGYSPPYDLHVNQEYVREFGKNNYQVTEYVTFLADLSKSIDEIWQGVNKKARGDVNRAKRRDITVKELDTYDELKQYLLLHQSWAKTKGLQIADPFEEIEKIWNNHNSGLEKFFLAYKDSELISGLRITCFNGIAYTHFVINSYSEHTNLGGTLLTWSAIEWAKKSGIRYYDFSGGTKSQDDSKPNADNTLIRYKKKWGGNETTYFKFLKIRKKYAYTIYKFLSIPLAISYRLKSRNHTLKLRSQSSLNQDDAD